MTNIPACPECDHPLDEHGKYGCMDSDHPGERNQLGFCVCLRSLTELLSSILSDADAAGFQRGVEKLDALRRQQAPTMLTSSPGASG